MLKSLSLRAYSSQTHTHTHKVFHKLFKHKIDINPSNLSHHDLRSQMALYLINNPELYHRNHPELLYELQQHHSLQYKKLEQFKEIIGKDIHSNDSSDNNMIGSLFLLGMDYKIDELLYAHRRQIRKVDDVKRQSPDFWAFNLPEE
ncbi:hypothetical protein Klosneuvirus_4_69 [Klosneuvirus KNV1]|uniref:Uncharacterized protein n=1 Tax=Klosneuvirus KNV1 TaxID=1977640 RepID=A0A1V0SKV1_9VIRU|nr:hypothetical protein Klosneuvirus_4_69 [Klosneuvirus KNV1]